MILVKSKNSLDFIFQVFLYLPPKENVDCSQLVSGIKYAVSDSELNNFDILHVSRIVRRQIKILFFLVVPGFVRREELTKSHKNNKM